MFTPDPKTLSLVVGVANLLFALLATLYLARTRTSSPALDIWRWARLLAGCGFLVNLVSSAVSWVPPVLGNALQVLAAGFDIAAYCLLLGKTNWRKPLKFLVGTALVALLLASQIGDGPGLKLLVFSSIGVVFYSILSILLIRASHRDWLLKLIALIDAAMVVVLLLRVGRGLAVGPLVRFDSDAITLLLYLIVYFVVMINGFGFLLLAKQKGDRALYRALEELEQAQQNSHFLLAQAAHEFRTPAALIKASLDSLRFVQEPVPAMIASRLENIHEATRRLIQLSDTLLTQERLSDPAMFAPQREQDLSALLQNIVAPYAERVALSAPEQPVPFGFDATQLRIALQNLIDNALEHHSADNGPVRVILQSTPAEVEISITDHGCGIPDEEKANVFRPFNNLRGDFTRGVGLAIVDRIVRNHGGEVVALDNAPKGTLMRVRLPLSG